jgi:hypothetical protein
MSKLCRWSPVVVLLLFALVAFPAVTSASHSWNGYHWGRQANPFTVKLGDNVDSTWDPSLALSSSDWSQSTVLDTVVVTGGTSPKSCRPTDGRDEICNALYGNTGWLGVAQIWISGSHITQGTVKLNDTYHNSPPYNTAAWRNMVTCQEIGHTFGLDHQDENFNNANLGSCMDYTNDPSTNQHPNSHDYQQLVTIYSHLDSVTTVKHLGEDHAGHEAEGPMPPAMRYIDLAGPRQWGKLIGSTDHGLTSVYEADFGHGWKVFTFVIWADPDLMGRDGRGRYPGN